MRSPQAMSINKDLDVAGNQTAEEKIVVAQGYNTAMVHCQTEVALETQA